MPGAGMGRGAMKIQKRIVGVLAGTSLSAIGVPVMANVAAEVDTSDKSKSVAVRLDGVALPPLVAPTATPAVDLAAGSWSQTLAPPMLAGGYGASAPTLGAASITAQGVAGPDLPAVSGLNGSLSLAGGEQGTRASALVLGGELAAPISHAIGLQIDAALDYTAQSVSGGTSGQVFWRNPDQGLIGVYASYSFLSQINGGAVGTSQNFFAVERGGVNAAIYRGRVTLEAIAGVEAGSGLTRFFDSADLAYYPNDDLRVSIGHRYAGGNHYGNVSFEYQFAVAGERFASLFADGNYSDNHAKSFMAGLRIRFGKGKTLIRHDREDDPTTLLGLDSSELVQQSQQSHTAAPTTQAPTTGAPTTQAPTTGAPTTGAPTTGAPTPSLVPSVVQLGVAPPVLGQGPLLRPPHGGQMHGPRNVSPTTPPPSTPAPTTAAPTTAAPTTAAPTTGAPTTGAPTTGAPTTGAPTTGAPTTGVPYVVQNVAGPNILPPTQPPTQPHAGRGAFHGPRNVTPTTPPSSTPAPTTQAPTTGAPTTGAPTTGAPTTGAPTTAAPPTSPPS